MIDHAVLRSEFGKMLADVPLAVMVLESEGHVILWNSAAERLFGWSAQEVLGQYAPHVPEDRFSEAIAGLNNAVAADLDGVRRTRMRKDGSRLEVRMWTSRVRDESGTVTGIIAWFVDETALYRHELELEEKNRRVQLLQEIAVAANESDSLEPALRRALASVCEHLSCPLGHAFVIDERTGTLQSTGLWHAPGTAAERFEMFRKVTEAGQFAPGVGIAGRVLLERRPVWAKELSDELVPERAHAAQFCGIHTGFALPIRTREEVVAVMEFFCEEAREIDDSLLELMFHVGTQLGRVVERQRAERERARLAEQAHRATQEAARARTEKALSMLSARERDVLRHVSLGADNLKIAAMLGISERTVKAHLTSILTKLGLENRTQAARFAWTAGLEASEDATV